MWAVLVSLVGCTPTAVESPAEPPQTQPTDPSTTTAPAGPWPADRTSMALCYREDIDTVLAVDGEGRLVNLSTLSTGGLLARGRALVDRNGVMHLIRGSYEAQSITDAAAALSKSGAFAIEVSITPDAFQWRTTPAIISLAPGRGGKGAQLSLVQTDWHLGLRLGPAGVDIPTAPLSLCKLRPGVRNHIVLTYGPRGLLCYRNGRRVETIRCPWPFEATGAYRLALGDDCTGGADWWGSLEGVAVYSREMPPAEVLRNYHARLALEAKRPKVARLKIRATLLEHSTAPRRGNSPYYRAMAIGHFRVDKIIEGRYDRPEVLVACWARWRNSLLPFCTVPIGQSVELTLESFDDAGPGVTRSPVSVTLDDDTLALPWYYDAGLTSLKYEAPEPKREDDRETVHSDQNAHRASRLVQGTVLARPNDPARVVRMGGVAPPQ